MLHAQVIQYDDLSGAQVRLTPAQCRSQTPSHRVGPGISKHGAMPARLGAAMSVVFGGVLRGTRPIARCPRGARAYNGVKFRRLPHSSMITNASAAWLRSRAWKAARWRGSCSLARSDTFFRVQPRRWMARETVEGLTGSAGCAASHRRACSLNLASGCARSCALQVHRRRLISPAWPSRRGLRRQRAALTPYLYPFANGRVAQHKLLACFAVRYPTITPPAPVRVSQLNNSCFTLLHPASFCVTL